MPQALFRGPVDGISPWLMPVAHGLEHAREELVEAVPTVAPEALWRRPYGVASVGWHLLHTAGATDRLFTYAHGAALDDRQRDWLELERAGTADLDGPTLLDIFSTTVDRCFDALRALDPGDLHAPRTVGAARLPSTTLGLLVHAAEHAQRHSGQVVTTAKVLAGVP
ncbi:MAG: DinB family protein [Acidobacteriota bacterium]